MNDNNIETVYTLSPLQESLLGETLRSPNGRPDGGQFRCLLRGALDATTLELAWQRVVAMHSTLRTAFAWKRVKKPLQVVHRQVEARLDQRDWRGLPAGRQEELWQREAAWPEATDGSALSRAPLARLTLCRTDEGDKLVLSYSRLVLDRLSLCVVLRDLLMTYDELCAGRGEPARRDDAFQSYLSWLESRDWADAERFWQNALAGVTEPPILFGGRAADHPRPSSAAGNTQVVRPSDDVWRKLQFFLSGDGLSEADYAFGVLALVLARYAGEGDIVVGVTTSGHPTAQDRAAMVGPFVNVLPVRLRIAGEAPALDWLREAAHQRRAVSAYGHCSISQIKQWCAVPESSPLFRASFDGGDVLNDCHALQVGALAIEDGRVIEPTGCALDLTVIQGGGPAFELTFSDADSDTAARVADHLRTMLEAIGESPDRRVDSLPLLTDREIRQVIEEWNQTDADYPRHLCLNQLFEEQAAHRPDAIAVSFGDAQFTYREINERANQLAHHLRPMGVGPDVLVGVYLERSVEMILALLGVLKAGAAYVPFDLTYPLERLALLLEEIHCPVILTQEALLYHLPATWSSIVCLDSNWEEVATRPLHNPDNQATPDNLAYVMYTSGSTGRPKGVCITHQNVARLVRGNFFAELSGAEVMLALAPASFDASTFEIWGALLNGARLAVMPAELPSLADIGKALQDYQVTTLWLTAGLFHLMVAERLEDLRGVRQLLAGGDVLSPRHAASLLEGVPGCTLINGYGPTENTTFTCCHRMSDVAAAVGPSLPIGTPIANTRVYLLDRLMRPVPVGVAQELYAGGDGVGRGYIERPDLTAERFLPDPFSNTPGARLYNTGDLCRRRPDGVIEFIGRLDHQVKVRGYRVELSEIEALLNELPGIREAVTVVNETALGDKRLVAYLVTGGPGDWAASDLRERLKDKLPDYMIPAYFVLLESLPLTTNGKLDRSALPAPEEAAAGSGKDFVAPRTDTEEVLARLWAEVLQLERAGIEDHFFRLGGQSLTAIQLISRVRDVFLIDVPLRCIFEAPTVSSFAERLAEYEQRPGQIAAIARLQKEVDAMTEGEVCTRIDEEKSAEEVKI